MGVFQRLAGGLASVIVVSQFMQSSCVCETSGAKDSALTELHIWHIRLWSICYAVQAARWAWVKHLCTFELRRS